MANNIAIKWLVFGEASQEQGLTPIRLALATERVSVRELISRAVSEQIQALIGQQHAEAGVIQMALPRQYLTAKDVELQAEAGRIRFTSNNLKPAVLNIDIDQEVGKALQGFTAQAFRVVVDGVAMESLEQDIVLKQETKVVFLRLTPLAGG